MTDAPRDAHGHFRRRPFLRAWHAGRGPLGWVIVGALLTLLAQHHG